MNKALASIALTVAVTAAALAFGERPQNPTQVPQKQQIEDLAEWNELAPYLRVIAAYRAGRMDEAVQDILRWSRTELDEARHRVQRLRHHIVPCRKVTPAIDGRTFAGEIEVADLDAAVLLHTDAAFWALGHGIAFRAQSQFRAAQPLFDWTRAQDWVWESCQPTFSMCDQFMPLGCHPLPELSRRDWYLAVSWSLLLYWELDLADAFAGRGLESAPGDAELLLAAATIKEGLALDATQFSRVRSKLPARVEDNSGPSAPRDESRSLNEARDLYRRALGVQPVYIQTHLRLGRVLSRLDRLDEARAELELVAANADEAFERYLAELFLARVEEQAEDEDAAVAHYRRALDAWPESQAARIGLVHALGLADGGAGASQQLAALLAVPWPQPMTFDPWWAYPFGEGERGFRRLDALRRHFVVTR